MHLSEADASPRRRPWRWVAAGTAILVAGAVAARIVVGDSLTPRTNAVIALCVFGGFLGLVLLQRRVPRGDGS